MKLFTFILFALSAFWGQLFSAVVNPGMSSSGPVVQHGNVIQGEVIQKQSTFFVVKEGEMKVQLELPANLRVKKNAWNMQAQDLAVHDNVKIAFAPDGSISTVSALSGNVMDMLTWSVPVALSGIALIILAIQLGRKIGQTHIGHHRPAHGVSY